MARRKAAAAAAAAVAALAAAVTAASAQAHRFQPPVDWTYNITNEPVPGKLNVHITPHTHDDTGWLMTVDQYFYSQVRYILDTVTDALAKDPKRKFNYVEMAFFSRWWEEQKPETKRLVRRLVKDKQLEFLNGGWCMHDEAGPLYTEMIDQTTRGHQFILNEFGIDAAPRATWQIDPFGHTNTQAWLLSAEAGMPSLFWARMDRDDRDMRRKTKEQEYIWRGSQSLGADADTFGSVIWGSEGEGLYSCPLDFENYDKIGVQDNPQRHDYNVEEWIEFVVSHATKQAAEYKSNHILWTCGFDFTYKNADTWYHNIDLIMHYVNQDGRIHLLYSSPANYVDAKNRDDTVSWKVREDDLMPLHERAHVYWTGYFTSRPAFKRLVRTTSNLLSSARQIEFLTRKSVRAADVIATAEAKTGVPHRPPVVGASWTDALEGGVSLAMHHDGVSGTAKQDVNGDYAQRIAEGYPSAEAGISHGLNALLGTAGDREASWTICHGLNISMCDLTSHHSDSGFSVLAWNPRAQPYEGYTFRIPVRLERSDAAEPFEVTVAGNVVPTQLIKLDWRTHEIPLYYLNYYALSDDQAQAALKELRNSATHALIFQADIPPVGYTVANVRAQQKQAAVAELGRKTSLRPAPAVSLSLADEVAVADDSLVFDTGVYRVELHPVTKLVETVTHLPSGHRHKLNIEWGFYASNTGGCSESGCGDTNAGAESGAYIFRPNSTRLHYPGAEEQVRTEVVRGPIVTEIRQRFSSWVTHVIRLTRGAPSIEVEYTVGPIPIDNPWVPNKPNLGKEVAVRYITDMVGAGKQFFTDSNGMEMIERVRDERPASHPQTYSWRDEPVASNYYPINAMIGLKDGEHSFTVVTDASQGGTSLNDGELELMVNRRVLVDDHKGVVEHLNETMCGCNGKDDHVCRCAGLVVRGTHQLIFDSPARGVNAAQQFRPSLFFTSDADVHSDPWSAVQASLPPNVHLLTTTANYADKRGGRVLVRLQHMYGVGEHPELSKPVTVKLNELFDSAKVGKFLEATEMTLTGNNLVEDKFTYKWNLEDESLAAGPKAARVAYDTTTTEVTLRAMEIRTFWVSFADAATA